MAFVIPLGVVMIILYVLICRFVFRIDVSALKNMPEDMFGKNEKLNRDQKMALGYLIVMIITLLSTSILPKTWGITVFLTKITMFGQAGLVILLLMLLKKEDGTPFFKYSYCAAKGMSWEGLWMTAFILPIASNMTAEGTGIKEGLSMLLAPLSSLSPILFLVGIMLFAGIITNVANNVTLAIVILPVAITFAAQMGMPPLGVACMLFIVTQLALFTPGASVFSGMAFSQSEWVKAPMMMKYAIIAVVLLILLFLLIAIPFMFIVF
jgi:sodium-dependent dicarboxylate transporter 2/3/5